MSRIELRTDFNYRFTPGYWLNLGYRYADFDDDAPYLVDTTGSIGIYSLAFGHEF